MTTTFIEEPTTCPSCSSSLEKVNDQLFCRNTACPAKNNKKIEHYCKVMGIKGMGPKSIEKLGLQEVTELYSLTIEEASEALGAKVAEKLLLEIEKTKITTFSTLLEAMAIPLVGGTASKKLAVVVSSIDEINKDTCKTAGLGEKVTENLLTWVYGDWVEIKDFLPVSITKAVPVTALEGKSVCITGKLKSVKTKAEAEVKLTAAGYTVVDSVTKTTNYLLDETDGASSKREKAEKYGITIITDLNDLLKEI
jgi:DNA ligase (NAD+)